MEDTPDLSKSLEQLQEMLSGNDGQNMLQSIIQQFSSSGNADSSPTAEQESPASPFQGLAGGFSGADMNTVSQIMNVMQAMNNSQSNSKLTFLQSLKPFLKESRQQKLDKAATLVKMASVFKMLKQNDGGGV